MHVDRDCCAPRFSDLIVTDRMLDQLGPAIISQNSIFVYGPTGNGKTSLAERMLRVYKDAVLIPYAVEVDNQIISLVRPGGAPAHRIMTTRTWIRAGCSANAPASWSAAN